MTMTTAMPLDLEDHPGNQGNMWKGEEQAYSTTGEKHLVIILVSVHLWRRSSDVCVVLGLSVGIPKGEYELHYRTMQGPIKVGHRLPAQEVP